jgi:hypothetical protein
MDHEQIPTDIISNDKQLNDILFAIREIIETSQVTCESQVDLEYMLQMVNKFVSEEVNSISLAKNLLTFHRQCEGVKPIRGLICDKMVLLEARLADAAGNERQAWYILRENDEVWQLVQMPSLYPISEDEFMAIAMCYLDNALIGYVKPD